jgi:predicted amidohydrolase
MKVIGGHKEEKLRHAEALLAEAARDADVLLLPEAMSLGWTHPASQEQADPIPDGMTCALLQAAARQHLRYICSGLVERAGEQIFNSAVLIDPHGEVVLLHRKLNELEIGHDCYDQGDRLGVAHTPLGTLGLMICADGFARGQVISRALGYMGAQVILSPCAWAVPADHDNDQEPYGDLWRQCYRPVARDFRLWIAGASNVGWLAAGPWEGWKCIGCSLVIGPDGEEVVQGPYGPEAETILYVELDPKVRPARGCGWEACWSEASSKGDSDERRRREPEGQRPEGHLGE